MLFFGNKMYEKVITEPYSRDASGDKTLYAITGYASGSFVQHILSTYNDVNLHLIIGMARRNGILKADHDNYLDILDRYQNRFHGYYYTGSQAVHAKAYAWQSKSIEGIIGSANFTNSGMHHNYEVMHIAQQPESIIDAFNQLLDNSMSINQTTEDIQIIHVRPDQPERVASLHGTTAYYGESVILSLLMARKEKQIHNKGGLNWGHRDNRNRNEAYIPVHKPVRDKYPDFFPDKGKLFTIITDDGESLICKMVQDDKKAIETSDDNSILGLYFRKRIGVPSGAFVSLEDLEDYGRTDVTLKKLDDDTYFLDFSI